MTRFELKSALFNKLSPLHIPYYLGMIVFDRKTGLWYFIDEFNTERILDVKGYRYGMTCNTMADIALHKHCIRYTKVEYSNEEEKIAKIVAMYKCNIALVRKDGMSRAIKIGKDIDI